MGYYIPIFKKKEKKYQHVLNRTSCDVRALGRIIMKIVGKIGIIFPISSIKRHIGTQGKYTNVHVPTTG